jgi:serine/threonine-protein kinase
MPVPLAVGPVPRRVWRAGRLVILALALTATFGVFFLAAMQVVTRAREVAVPDLRGRSLSDAEALVADVGLRLRIDPERRTDTTVPFDHVLSQEPPPGTVLRRQRSVRVRASDGARDREVPNVVGVPARTAELTLSSARHEVAGRAEIYSRAYETAGLVIAQDPPARLPGKAVAILVSQGTEAAAFVMPDVIGALARRAIEALRGQGFRVVIGAEVAYPGVPAGYVVRQSPQAGFQIGAADAILLEVTR